MSFYSIYRFIRFVLCPVNYGFDYIADKLEDNPDHFFKDRAFLNEIIKFMISSEDVKTDNNDDEEAESLD